MIMKRLFSLSWPEMGKKGGGGGWFSSVKKVFKQSPTKESPEKKVSLSLSAEIRRGVLKIISC